MSHEPFTDGTHPGESGTARPGDVCSAGETL